MGDFYGYNSAVFLPSYGFIPEAAAQLQKIPEYVRYEQAIREGKLKTGQIYEAVSGELSEVDDEEFKNHFKMDKNTFMKMLRPDRKELEEPGQYTLRVAKAMEPYKDVLAKQNYLTAKNQIEMGGNTPQEIGQIGGLQSEGTYNQLADAGIAPQRKMATPEQIADIATQNNVPMDKFQGQMTEAINRRTGEQIGKINSGMTQIEGYGAIGGGATEETQKAIGGLMDQKEKGSLMVDAAEAQNQKSKTSNERIKQAKDDTAKLLDVYTKRLNETDDQLLKLGIDPANTFNTGALDQDKLNEREGDLLKKRREIVGTIKQLQKDLDLAEVNSEVVPDESKQEAERFMTERIRGTATSPTEIAKEIVKYANEKRVALDGGAIAKLLEEGAQVEEIIHLILTRSPSWHKSLTEPIYSKKKSEE